MVIETATFRLKPGIEEADFLAADRRLQTDFAYQQRGLVRRTTARGTGRDGAEWLVIELWGSVEDVEASGLAGTTHDAVRAFAELIDPSTLDVRRYLDLG